jgi:hypothetical protein
MTRKGVVAMFVRLIVLVLFIIFLPACTSISTSHYRYSPPYSRTGQHCIAQCMQGKFSCEKLCLLKNPRCEMHAQQTASYDYAAYLQQQHVAGKSAHKHLKDFIHDDDCKHACHCTQAFNTCYTACGGQVSSW